MKPLALNPQKDQPRVDFQPETGRLTIEGECYPENALEFFTPLYQWLQEYIREVERGLVMDIKLQYFNSSSSKCLLDLFEIIENYHQQGGKAVVNWHYQEDDEDIQESGEDYAEDLGFEFNLISNS